MSVNVIITDELAIAAGRIAQAHRGDSIQIRYEEDQPESTWFVIAGGESVDCEQIVYVVDDETGFIDPPLQDDPS